MKKAILLTALFTLLYLVKSVSSRRLLSAGEKAFLGLVMALFFFTSPVLSQTGITTNYPLKIGNIFVFKTDITRYPPNDTSYYTRSKIDADTIAYGKRYYRITYYPESGTGWFRLDTLTGRLLIFNNNTNCNNYFHEGLLDSLWAGLGDSAWSCTTFRSKCVDTGNTTIFGQIREAKKFAFVWSYINSGIIDNVLYARDFGLIYRHIEQWGIAFAYNAYHDLKGCVLNGVVYGDTAMPLIGMQNMTESMPSSFKLYQNYPNPFNPTTTIKFDTYRAGSVSLYIYDIIGRELFSIQNQNLSAGTYEFNWDSRDYPSGVYICRVTSEGFNSSIKMILAK